MVGALDANGRGTPYTYAALPCSGVWERIIEVEHLGGATEESK